MANVMIDFEEGRQLHRVQQHRLGEIAEDSIGNTWSYVQFRGEVGIGEVVRDAVHSDLITANNPGEVSAPAAVGTNRLTTSDEFQDTNSNPIDVRGAIGSIVGGTGYGQNFTVLERIDEDTIVVQVLTSRTGFVTDGNWETGLTTTSRYRLTFPGVVYQGSGLTDVVRGFAQVAVDDAKKVGRYGWVQQTGLGFVKLDVDDPDVPVTGDGLVPAGAGLVKGFTGTTTADEAAAVIAKCILGDFAGASDTLMWAELMVTNRAQSFRMPQDRHPFAERGQRI